MGRPKSHVWSAFNAKTDKTISCKYCTKTYQFANANKMTSHIQKCLKCPLEVRRKINKSEKKIQFQNEAASSFNETVRPQSSASCSSTYASETVAKGIDAFLDTMKQEENDRLNDILAKALFVSGSPLSLVEHPLWIDFFKQLRPSYKLPTRKALSTKYLNSTYTELKFQLTKQLEDSKNLNLQCDGWSNIRNEGIINIIITKPEPIFVDFIETKENRHTAEYIEQQITDVLEKYGPKKFLVVIGDNAANMKKAFKSLIVKYKHLVPLSCLAHTLNLLCQDILKCKSVNTFISTVTNIVKTFKNSHILSALLQNIAKAKNCKVSLKLPAQTRWGSYLYCLESIIANKPCLQTLAINEEATTIITKDIKNNLLDDDVFWMRVEKLCAILKPIVSWIIKLQSADCKIHVVHALFHDIEISVATLLPESPLTKAEEVYVIQKMNHRKESALHPIHYAAALLDPKSQGHDLSNEEQVEAVEFIHSLAEIMGTDVTAVMRDVANYRAQEGLWSKLFFWTSVDVMTPVVWWRGLCSATELCSVAVKILTAPTTSAETERSFSTFSWIHSKKRNRLTSERAGRLTYISHNWKLLQNHTCQPNIRNSVEDFEQPKQSTTSHWQRLNNRRPQIEAISDEEIILTTSDSESESEEYCTYGIKLY